MGLATIINMICFVCVPAWGQGAAILAWTLWWIDVVLSLATNMYMPFVMYAVAFEIVSRLLSALTECENTKLSFQQ